MSNINHGPVLETKELSRIARMEGRVLADDESNQDEIGESQETIADLLNGLIEMGIHIDCNMSVPFTAHDAQEIARAYENLSASQSTLIAEWNFSNAVKNLMMQTETSLFDLSEYIVIDWSATANRVRENYQAIALGGHLYMSKI